MAIPPAPVHSRSDLSILLRGCFVDALEDDMQCLIQGLYGLWLARNATKEGNQIDDPNTVVNCVFDHLQEWRNLHTTPIRAPKHKTTQRWDPPDEGWLKVNSDGSMPKHNDYGGGGAVIRDHQGAYRGGVYFFFLGVREPALVELLAYREAVKIAVQ